MANIHYLRCTRCGNPATPRKWNPKTPEVLAEVGTSITMHCADCCDPTRVLRPHHAMMCRDCCPTGHGTRFNEPTAKCNKCGLVLKANAAGCTHASCGGIIVIPQPCIICHAEALEGRKYCAAHQERANHQTLKEKVAEQRAACTHASRAEERICEAEAEDRAHATPPNAAPFLTLRPEMGTVTAHCGCLLEPASDEPDPDAVAFYQCETHEQAEATKRHLSAALDCLDELADFLEESHASGAGPSSSSSWCSYCRAIAEAREVSAAAKGLQEVKQ